MHLVPKVLEPNTIAPNNQLDSIHKLMEWDLFGHSPLCT